MNQTDISPEIEELSLKRPEQKKRAYKKIPNPIEAQKIRCAVKSCSSLGFMLLYKKAYCKAHYKELKEVLKKYGIRNLFF